MALETEERGRTVPSLDCPPVCPEVVLEISMVQHGALGLYHGMSFQGTDQLLHDYILELMGMYTIHLRYYLPSGQEVSQ
jgi:hypothetical protein